MVETPPLSIPIKIETDPMNSNPLCALQMGGTMICLAPAGDSGSSELKASSIIVSASCRSMATVNGRSAAKGPSQSSPPRTPRRTRLKRILTTPSNVVMELMNRPEGSLPRRATSSRKASHEFSGDSRSRKPYPCSAPRPLPYGVDEAGDAIVGGVFAGHAARNNMSSTDPPEARAFSISF